MVMAFEVAGLLEVQTVLDEIRTHVTISPFAGVYAYVRVLEPALMPFTFQW